MSIKVLNEKIFTKTWCPLFGVLPLFRDNIPNTSIKKCIVNICQARDIWEAKDKEDYPELKLNIAQSIYKKAVTVNDHIQRDEIFSQARKLSKLLFDHLESDYHTLAIMAIDKAWQALCGMLKDGKPEADAGIMEQVFAAGSLIETANKLLSDAKQIKLKNKINTLIATLKDKQKIVRKAVGEALRSKENVLVYNKKTQDMAKQDKVIPFPTPPGAKVSDIKMVFWDDQNVRITIKEETKPFNYAQMGFSHKQTARPLEMWDTLLEYAEYNDGALRNVNNKKQKDSERINEKLKSLFETNENLIIGNRTVFSISKKTPKN